ncbi:hypothetical protein EJ06DRAFT_532817 [Trichodelitschia bisporula]|uniref:Uncharacterized protein n=1 Tax=Trichodelitschia bisporula TaxID=703511 RepID=A0A6G1HP39_9PEZI|nr:hypothetical protein EJ06DRAFT_532817 [Trichodelitschia bisporula]
MREEQVEKAEDAPRSPLLTDGFLNGVSKPTPARQAEEDGSKASSKDRSVASRGSEETSSKDGKKKKEKKEKKSKFGMLGEMWSEYKDSTNALYFTGYSAEYEAQQAQKDVKRSASRPSTGSESLVSSTAAKESTYSTAPTPGPTVATLTPASHHHYVQAQYEAHRSTQRADREPKRSDSVAETRPPSSAGHYGPVPPRRPSRDAETSLAGGNSGAAEGAHGKQGKFPTLTEMWSEYKSMGEQWYTAPYKSEEQGNIANPR